MTLCLLVCVFFVTKQESKESNSYTADIIDDCNGGTVDANIEMGSADSMQCVNECSGNPRWARYCGGTHPVCVRCGGITDEEKEYLNERPQSFSFYDWDENDACSNYNVSSSETALTFFPCDADTRAFDTNWNATIHVGIYQRWYPSNENNRGVCTSNILEQQCAINESGEIYTFRPDGFKCNTDSDCYQLNYHETNNSFAESPGDRPYPSRCIESDEGDTIEHYCTPVQHYCGDDNTQTLSQKEATGEPHDDIDEACDDGNRVDGDGCSKNCQVENNTQNEGGGNSCPAMPDGHSTSNLLSMFQDCAEICNGGTAPSGDQCVAYNPFMTENGVQCNCSCEFMKPTDLGASGQGQDIPASQIQQFADSCVSSCNAQSLNGFMLCEPTCDPNGTYKNCVCECNSGTCNHDYICDSNENSISCPVDCVMADGCSLDTDTCGNECNSDSNCNDGLFCNGSETCEGGVCQEGTDVECSEGSCSEETNQCVECSIDSDCNDGLFCNGSETCASGSCTGGTAPSNCESCNEETDSCEACSVDSDCDDGLFCNGEESCQNGSCVDGANVTCEDGSCNEETNACESNATDDDIVLDVCDEVSVVLEGIYTNVIGGTDLYSLNQQHTMASCNTGDELISGGGELAHCDNDQTPACNNQPHYEFNGPVTAKGQESWVSNYSVSGDQIYDNVHQQVVCSPDVANKFYSLYTRTVGNSDNRYVLNQQQTTALCDTGDIAVHGGGYNVFCDTEGDAGCGIQNLEFNGFVVQDGKEGWKANHSMLGDATYDTVQTTVVCLKKTPLFDNHFPGL